MNVDSVSASTWLKFVLNFLNELTDYQGEGDAYDVARSLPVLSVALFFCHSSYIIMFVLQLTQSPA